MLGTRRGISHRRGWAGAAGLACGPRSGYAGQSPPLRTYPLVPAPQVPRRCRQAHSRRRSVPSSPTCFPMGEGPTPATHPPPTNTSAGPGWTRHDNKSGACPSPRPVPSTRRCAAWRGWARAGHPACLTCGPSAIDQRLARPSCSGWRIRACLRSRRSSFLRCLATAVAMGRAMWGATCACPGGRAPTAQCRCAPPAVRGSACCLGPANATRGGRGWGVQSPLRTPPPLWQSAPWRWYWVDW